MEGLLLQAGVTPHDPLTGQPRGDTLGTVMEILRKTSLSRVKLHAGLGRLAARHVMASLDGTSLEGLSVTVALRRDDAGDLSSPGK